MKKFQTPAIKVEHYNVEDIITTSGGNGPEMPDDEF